MTKKESWDLFLELCTKLKSPEEFDKFFDLFLTIEEKNLLRSRFLIIKSLFEKTQSQRDIASSTQVSIAQITRGSNALKRIDPQTEQFLKSHL